MQGLSLAKRLLAALGGVFSPSPISEEELNPTDQDDLAATAVPIEAINNGYDLQFNPNTENESLLCYFEDGKQRTVQIGFIPIDISGNNTSTIRIIPVHYFVVAAVILSRQNKNLHVWQNPVIRQGILLEKSMVSPEIIFSFEQQGLEIIDTPSENLGADYYELKRIALQKAKDLRLEVETELINKWKDSEKKENQFLVVDGTLMNFRNDQSLERCIGISKSFKSRFHSIDNHNKILQLEQYTRSWLFRFHSAEESDLTRGVRERISWYLKLRKTFNSDPEYGLIRVEISPKHLQNASEIANILSYSLLLDRLPTFYPYPRWDKHLYPIAECENYLSSIMPSIDTINASMKF